MRAILALAITGFILAGMGGGSVFAYSSVKRQAIELEAQLTEHLQLGQSELEAAKTSLANANATHDDKLISEAKARFIVAGLHFSTARQIADSSDLLSRLENVPSVGEFARSRHAAVDALSEMGTQLALAGQDLADLDGQLIKPAGSGPQSRSLLAMIGEVHSKIGSVRTELDGAFKAANRVNIGVLPTGQQATFLKARGTIGQAVGAIDQFEALVPILTEILGGNGARNYLFQQVNPAELRAGGGFAGTFSIMRADHGTLSLIRSGDASQLVGTRALVGQPGYVNPPGPLREFIPNTSWSFFDSNFFPDFPSNAQAAETFAQPHLGFRIDAVIAIDYYAVAKMLEFTGPLAAPGFGLTVNATNFIPLVFQYDIATSAHYALLSSIAGPLTQGLTVLPADRWPALVGALNDLAASRHLQAYFNNPVVQKTIDQFGWSGVLKPTAASDYMMEVESNLGGTKANYFVTRHYTVELTRRTGSLHHRVTVDIRDDMPYSYVPQEYYRAYIRLYISDKTTATYTDLVPPRYPNPAPPGGTKMLDGWMNIHGYGHNRVVQFEWDTPWQSNGRGEQQIYWQKQPGTINDKIDVIWHDGNGHTYKASGVLGQDRVITLAPAGVTLTQGQTGTAQLPSLSLG